MTGVCITGLGLVSAAGLSSEHAERALLGGISGIRKFDPSEQQQFGKGSAARIREHLPDDFYADEPRIVRYLLRAIEETLAGAGLSEDELQRTGLILGTSQGAITEMATIHRDFHNEPDSVHDDARKTWRRYSPGYAAEQIAHALRLTGPRSTMGMVCVSSAAAIWQGVRWIRSGRADRVLAGGFEEHSPFVQAGFGSIGALGSDLLRPFDKRRDGTILGEAAAMVLLEREDAAAARKARCWGKVLGGGLAADASHMTAPDREGGGLQKAIHTAFADARLNPKAIDYICAHGTGTKYNDLMETKAFAAIFGADLGGRPISSVKSVFGHTLGAAGALDVICVVRGMIGGFIPGTVNHEESMIENWDFVPGAARRTHTNLVLSTNSAFGGNNSALILASMETEQ